MQKISENKILLKKGEHKIFLKRNSNPLGYKPISNEHEEDNPITIEFADEYVEYYQNSLYVNTMDVIVPKENLTSPGTPLTLYNQIEEDKVVIAKGLHEIHLVNPNFNYELMPNSKLYRNKCAIIIPIKELDENIPGKSYVKTLK